MSWLEPARRWWQEFTGEEETPLDGDTPAWAMSLVLHVVVLLSMALIGLPAIAPKQNSITILAPTQVVEEDVLLAPEMTVAVEEESAASSSDAENLEVSTAVASVVSDDPLVNVDVAEALDGELAISPIDLPPSGAELGDSLQVGRVGNGDTGVGTAGTGGAVDRLTMEIAASLQQRTTVVCWVFDQSVSLAGQRKEIAGRLDRVFDELGLSGAEHKDHELLNLVFAYGQKVTPLVKDPSRETGEVVKAIESIPIDESGVEMTFTAIAEAAKKAKQVRVSPTKRNVMIIAFTDEVGNDQQYADQVAAFCRSQAMRVYVVGVPAPFGTREVKIKFTEFDPRYADDVQWAVVEQGPETLHPEVVRVRSGRDTDEPIDSGFGPFSLSKLCAETGGIYFCVHANRNASGRVNDGEVADMASRLRYFFDPAVMRSYRPDYQPAAKIESMLASNRAMKSLVDAARSSQVAPMDSPTLEFPRQDDGALALLLGEAQKKAAVLQPKIDALYGILTAGLPDRDKVTEKRWQAGYDLAMGRVMAVKVRTDSYNIMLAQAKTGMKFKNPKNDTWRLVPDDDISAVGSQTEKLAAQSLTFLKRVVGDHPGTPWAQMAAEELRQPLGYRWEEHHTGVNTPKMDGGGGNANPADDKKRMLAPPKPKRPLKNL
ncbi:MAG: VWA domain-containing protein [Planctomycetia bacterium]|nr:VWA domain-containing protein [Planctomycetia bacterium]